jgi:hypothetical protein
MPYATYKKDIFFSQNVVTKERLGNETKEGTKVTDMYEHIIWNF